MSDNHRPDEPLDPKLRAWLNAEIPRRVLPQHWPQPLQQLASWAQTYRDGRALYDLLQRYPRSQKPEEKQP